MSTDKATVSITEDEFKGEGQHKVTLMFHDEKASEFAIKELYKNGYKSKDIGVVSHQALFNRPCMILGPATDSVKVALKKAIDGIKLGAVGGGLLAGLFIVIVNNSFQPTSDLLLFIFMGIVWGAVLGFLMKQLIPFHPIKYYERNLVDGNVLIQFNTKFHEKRSYFNDKNWTLCQLGLINHHLK